MASPSSSNDTFQIPVIDISAFTTDGHTQTRKETAAKLADCCRRYGCAGVAGHGVSLDLLQKAFDLAKRLFDLPKEEKIKAPRPEDVMVQRGYIAPNQEKTSGKTAVEAKNAEQKEAAKKIMDYKVRFRFEHGSHRHGILFENDLHTRKHMISEAKTILQRQMCGFPQKSYRSCVRSW